MSHHIVEARDVHFSYPDGTDVLKGIKFRIMHGESVAIIGANGAGKSTLLLQLIGFLHPLKGELFVGESLISKKNMQEIRRTIGMVFQEPDDQLFMPTVFDDVAFGPINMGVQADHVNCCVDKALNKVNAIHLKDKSPYKLSGGEKRRVAIAATLSMDPSILVMDEPSSNLDPISRRQLINLLKTFDHTKIIATHDLDMVLDLCERTMIIHDGQIVADEETKNLLSNSALLEEYGLEMPLSLQGCPVCGTAS